VVLGVTHAEVGSWLAKRWNLPDQLVDAIAYHHAPGRLQRNAELPSLIHLADFLCRRECIGDGGGDRMPNLDPAALRAFGIHDEPRAAMKRLLAYGNELHAELAKLHAELAKADAFASIIRGDDEAAPVQDEGASDGEEEAAG